MHNHGSTQGSFSMTIDVKLSKQHSKVSAGLFSWLAFNSHSLRRSWKVKVDNLIYTKVKSAFSADNKKSLWLKWHFYERHIGHSWQWKMLHYEKKPVGQKLFPWLAFSVWALSKQLHNNFSLAHCPCRWLSICKI